MPIHKYAVKWLPCGCQKLQPTVFWHLEAKPTAKKPKKNCMFLITAPSLVLSVRTMLSTPWRNENNTFGPGRCAIVGLCCKMAPLRLPKVAPNRFLAFGDQTKSENRKKKLFVPRCCPQSDSACWDYAERTRAEPNKYF